MRPIDADELELRKFTAAGSMPEYGRGWNDALAAVVKNAPTIEAAPVRHGSWKFTSCSLCGKSFLDYAESDCDKGMYSDLPNYCPNCGTKMDGGDDNGK